MLGFGKARVLRAQTVMKKSSERVWELNARHKDRHSYEQAGLRNMSLVAARRNYNFMSSQTLQFSSPQSHKRVCSQNKPILLNVTVNFRAPTNSNYESVIYSTGKCTEACETKSSSCQSGK